MDFIRHFGFPLHVTYTVPEWIESEYFLHGALATATLTSLAVKTHGNAAVVVFIVLTAALALALKRHARKSKSFEMNMNAIWVTSALMLEALLWMWASITAQVIVTGVLFGGLFIRASKHTPPTQLYLVIWLLFRATAVTVFKSNSPVATWYASQLILLILLGMHVATRGAKDDKTYRSYRAPIVTGALIVVFFLYSTANTVPRGINILLVMAPLLYFITVAIEEAPQTPLTIGSQESALITVILICIAISMAWDHTADEDSSRALCDREKHNTRECIFPHDVVAGRTKCCCISGFHYVLGTDGCARHHCMFTSDVNTRRLQQGSTLIDCCGNEVLAGFNELRAGPDMCMCGNTKVNPAQHGYAVAGNTATCVCAPGYTGPCCLYNNNVESGGYS